MEVLSLRFPHLIETIFCELDNQNLVDFREVNRTFRSFIDNGRFRWIRIIQKFVGNISNPHKEPWKKVLHKAPTQNIQELGKAVKKFFEVRKSRIQHEWAPLHIAAERGRLTLCAFILNKTDFCSVIFFYLILLQFVFQSLFFN